MVTQEQQPPSINPIETGPLSRWQIDDEVDVKFNFDNGGGTIPIWLRGTIKLVSEDGSQFFVTFNLDYPSQWYSSDTIKPIGVEELDEVEQTTAHNTQ